jgi:hypothetical protein
MLHPQAFLQIQQRWGPLVVDLFASSLTIYPAAEILQLETKPRGRCFQSGLDTTPGEDVCQPPVEPGGESPEQSLPAEDHASPGCPSVEEPMLLESLVDFPILLPQRADLIILTHPESVPEMMSRLAAWHISGDATRIRIFSQEGTELLLTWWRQKSSQSYDSLFRKWIICCSGRSSDPVSGPISEVVNCLAHLFKEGYQYRSLNAYRSAISSVHERVDGYEVGQHPLVSRVMKGAFNLRPPQPRHESTWYVSNRV